VPASDVKKRGWRGVMRTLDEAGAVVVTNHDEPEAVILNVKEYRGLLALAEQARSQTASELDALRRRFDARLAALNAPGAGDRLRAAARRPAKLRGKVKAGGSF
jgi:PHD/YefM family antitoxin component YafN of YafNO toxin-antitoxin module